VGDDDRKTLGMLVVEIFKAEEMLGKRPAILRMASRRCRRSVRCGLSEKTQARSGPPDQGAFRRPLSRINPHGRSARRALSICGFLISVGSEACVRPRCADQRAL
jgi:hypothetical protein